MKTNGVRMFLLGLILFAFTSACGQPQTTEARRIIKEKFGGNCQSSRVTNKKDYEECMYLLGQDFAEGEFKVKKLEAGAGPSPSPRLSKSEQAWKLKIHGKEYLQGVRSKWQELGGRIESYDIQKGIEQLEGGDNEFYKDLLNE